MHARLCVLALPCALIPLLACTGTPSGGGPLPVAAVGAPCSAALYGDACGQASDGAQRLRCDPIGNTWILLETCAPPQACWLATDPAAPTKKISTCAGATTPDAGSGDASDDTVADAGPTDTANDAAPSDGSGPGDGTQTDGTVADAQPDAALVCGDGVCGPGEACPLDCKTQCGDLKCLAPEQYATCPVDCGTYIPALDACAKKACPAAWQAMFDCAPCLEYLNCALKCAANSDCIMGCYDSLPASAEAVFEAIGECVESQCEGAWQPQCGDGMCEPKEDMDKCPADCPPVCGDGACSSGETVSSCPQDCDTCGNGWCETTEDEVSCPQDCTCGNGKCDPGESAFSCPQDCASTACGDGWCDVGEDAWSCPQDCSSTPCGDGWCDVGEDAWSCPQDCKPATFCGDGQCQTGETSTSCPQDCPKVGKGKGCTATGDKQLLATFDSDPAAAKAFADAHKKCTLTQGCLAKSSDAEKIACIGACLVGSTGLSGDCSWCYGEFDLCSAKLCLAQCAVDPTASACLQCVAQCQPALDVCKAGPPPPCPPCAAGQYCDAQKGQCTTPACQLPATWPHVQKIATMNVPSSTVGCDVDGDGKPNNVLGKMSDLYKDLNKVLNQQIADGKLVVLLQASAWQTNGTPFELRWLSGTPVGSGCDVTSAMANCSYLVDTASYDLTTPSGACKVKTAGNATVQGSQLQASLGGALAFPMPLIGLPMLFPLSDLTLSGTVTGPGAWTATQGGMLCGVTNKAAMDAAIDALPEDAFAQIGDKATVKSLIAGIFKPDLDLDGDGIKESISAAFTLTTVPGQITGLTP